MPLRSRISPGGRWFQDPVLQELIQTALKQNYDLQIATERINAARAQVAITRSALFPQLSGNGNFSGGKEQFFPLTANFLLLTADATFQLDFSVACGVPRRPRGLKCWQPRKLSTPSR